MDPSIVNYLSSAGQPSDYASRAKLAASKGIQGYVGSAQQNTQLLNMLRGSAPVPVSSPSSPTTASSVQPTQQTIQPTVQPNAVQTSSLVAQAKAAGQYQGWPDWQIEADLKTRGGQIPNQTAGVSGIPSLFNPPKIDLAGTYQNLFESSGISKIEADLSAKSKAYTEQVAKIKDNPYLSEATMTGRLKKIDEKFNMDTKNIRDDIAMRKADIETQLNLQTKQFDINNEQTQKSWSQLNSLISAGALTNASGEDIASITRATGIPSSMLTSIIDKQKKDAEVKPTITTLDDGKNQYAVALDQNGNVIQKTILASSKPKEPKAATADDKLSAGNFTNSQVSKAIKILAEADVLSNPDDKGDKLLSRDEQRQALLKIQSEIAPDPAIAAQLLEKAAIQGGFSDWTG